MKNIKFLLATSGLVIAAAAISAVAEAQTAPNVSTTDITTAGLNASTGLQNASGVTYFANNGETLLLLKAGGTALTATINSIATSVNTQAFGPIALTSPSIVVPSGTIAVLGPFPPGRFNNQYGLVGVSMSSITGVSASAINVPQP
ncbi:hypothetical protein ACSBOB_20160 [Mesorhizobium sp. ASY16-5R]|uniref:hypothetical protein n=1 Tax=Mesorhizobium sp. ASY16-5R TaxID=3445772 RepID=UPI003FA16A5E